MFKNFLSKSILAISTLTGTIIGVGFFSLPYITLQVGFWNIVVWFLVLGSLVILIHLFFGQIALQTPDLKRLPGFCDYYLGKKAKNVAFFSSILGIFGSLLAYLIVGGEFLYELFFPIFGGNIIFWTVIYFIFGALLIFWGTKIISRVEFWGLVLFFLILFLVFWNGKSDINIKNLFLKIGDLKKDWFLPYGPILFSLWGAALIPEIEELLKEKKKLKIVIGVSILISIVIYLFFIWLVLGITGLQTTFSALPGLKNFLNRNIFYLLIFFGIITTITSFISLGLTLKKIFWYDLGLGKNLSWAITCFPPFFCFLLGVKKFIPLISFIGGIMLGIDGILILMIYKKINRKNFMVYPLFLVLVFGIVYQIIYFF